MFCDAHFHIVPSQAACPSFIDDLHHEFAAESYCACTCAHDTQEFEQQKKLARAMQNMSLSIKQSFGIHPQMPLLDNVTFLDMLLQQNCIDAIGEMGFDLYTSEFKMHLEEQKKAWHIQLELALHYRKPIIVHCRKGLDYLFADKKQLKKVPAVLFHSFPAGPREALSLLQQGINGYFSFGKQILNGNKKAIACVTALPEQRLLLETDAPYQTLKNESATHPTEIATMYNMAYVLRSLATDEMRHAFRQTLQNNFTLLFR
ncbi:MAG: TatD family hydrolase [Treponema sp.]|nr:TatD family hydrolase [Treponema sp.]